MLLVQEYLREHTFAQLAEEHGIKASFYEKGYKWSLNYDQRFSVESDPLAQQCRGLVLATHDGHSLTSQAKMVEDRLRYDDICPGETTILAYPMDRFFNQGQGAAADVNFNDPHLRVMEKMDGCFDYDALLNCWDGSSISLELVLAGKEDDVIPALPPEIVDRILKIKKGIVDAIRHYDNTYNYLKGKADLLNKGDKKTFALLVKDTKIWSAPMFAMFDGKINGMNGFIEINRKEGTWSNGFLDKLLAISKNDDI